MCVCASKQSHTATATIIATHTHTHTPEEHGNLIACHACDDRYGGGETEAIMGRIGVAEFTVATKVNPFKTTPQPVEVGLSPSQVRAQFTHSLAALKLDSVDLLYLHAPDHEVPIMDTLAAVNELHKEGKFKRFGLSNFAAWQVAQICQLCEQHGFVKPSVYQGVCEREGVRIRVCMRVEGSVCASE